MKIESGNYSLATSQTAAAPRAGTESTGAVEAGQPVTAGGAQNSTVSLSSMSAVRSPSDSDIDTAKVESIKAALRDGTYTINPGAIADGMLNSARDLLKPASR